MTWSPSSLNPGRVILSFSAHKIPHKQTHTCVNNKHSNCYTLPHHILPLGNIKISNFSSFAVFTYKLQAYIIMLVWHEIKWKTTQEHRGTLLMAEPKNCYFFITCTLPFKNKWSFKGCQFSWFFHDFFSCLWWMDKDLQSKKKIKNHTNNE